MSGSPLQAIRSIETKRLILSSKAWDGSMSIVLDSLAHDPEAQHWDGSQIRFKVQRQNQYETEVAIYHTREGHDVHDQGFFFIGDSLQFLGQHVTCDESWILG